MSWFWFWNNVRHSRFSTRIAYSIIRHHVHTFVLSHSSSSIQNSIVAMTLVSLQSLAMAISPESVVLRSCLFSDSKVVPISKTFRFRCNRCSSGFPLDRGCMYACDVNCVSHVWNEPSSGQTIAFKLHSKWVSNLGSILQKLILTCVVLCAIGFAVTGSWGCCY